MSDWTWHRQTEDELAVRSSLGGGSMGVCTFASSVFSLSLRSVIRLQLRQSERKREKESDWLSAFTHTSMVLMQKAERATRSLFVLDEGSPGRADGRCRLDGFLKTS